MENKQTEENRQKLWQLIDKCVVNFRAVDNKSISPQRRDEMNKQMCDSFLQSLLLSQRQEIVKILEGLKKREWTVGAAESDPRNNYIMGHTEALSDAISIITTANN